MEEQSKYYYPAISELFVGYECEIGHNLLSGNPHWEKSVIEKEEIETEAGEYYELVNLKNTFRTAYLTKEQIEAEGWVYDGTYGEKQTYKIGDMWENDGKGGFLNYDPINHILKITTTDKGFNQEGPNSSIKFKGECKSINEFRKIIQWIGINKSL